MKKIILLAFLILQVTNVFSQNSSWQWATNAGGNLDDRGNGIATDSNGNIFTVGSFRNPTLTFGSYTLTNASYLSGFIVKQNSLGNVIWAKCLTGTGSNIVGCGDICSDNLGNIYVIGTFQGTVNFEGSTLTANGNSDIFIIKYDVNGNRVWVKQSNASLYSDGQKIFVDANGYIYITGVFGGTLGSPLTFDSQTVINSVQGYQDVYLFKFDSNGAAVWGKSIAGTTTKNVKSVGADNNGNVYLIGDFLSPTITVGSFTLTNSVSNSSTGDIYIARYNTSGNVVWARSFGGVQYDYGRDLKVDNNGNVHATGGFSGATINFNGTILNGNNSCANTFVLDFDTNFNILWGRSFPNNYNNNGFSVDVDTNGSTYVVGDFYSTLNIDSFSLTNVGTNGWGDIYVTKFDTLGNVLEVNTAGGNYIEDISRIRVDNSGNAYLTGRYYSPTLQFGSHLLTNSSTFNYSDIYIAKLVFNNLSIGEQDSKNKISIYPNPIITNSTIEFETEQINSILEILDLTGKEVKTFKFSGKKLILEKAEINRGTYLVRITNDENEIFVKKIIIE
ncbi:T9SS type A sorting domain-containing protein [Flavobacterium sp.]|uniref:T9SS type A sorting domain-containing protein n=1 Tax=Flavobacterium sp. TaxID=239 RepID=UPI0026201A80|nr:T9SS type A sorting domain-containing protein [Flavobacterium sp.]